MIALYTREKDGQKNAQKAFTRLQDPSCSGSAKEEQTSAKLDVHHSQITQWKKQLLEGATFDFEGN